LISQIRDVFQKAYEPKLKGVQWYVEGFLYPEETILRVGFGKPNQLKHHHYILSWNSTSESQMTAQLYQAIDHLDHIMSEHISGDQSDLPREWKLLTKKIEGGDCYFQYSTENLTLEKLANELLGILDSDGLTHGDWPSEPADDGASKSPKLTD
jgi:hypothetical protein